MIRLITNDDTHLQTSLNGKYKILLFITDASPSLSATNIIYFKFYDELRRNIKGNNYFVSDGYFYDNNTFTSNFKYSPQCDGEMQYLECDNLRNVKIDFFDRLNNTISIPSWELLIKKVL